MDEKSIYEHYTNDHEHIRRLLEQFQRLKTTQPFGAKQALTELRSALERHILWEERILFPWFDHKCAERNYSPTPAFKREHGQILIYLDDIARKVERGDFGTEEVEESLELILRLHNQREEEEFYSVLDKALNEAERGAVLEAMGRCQASISRLTPRDPFEDTPRQLQEAVEAACRLSCRCSS